MKKLRELVAERILSTRKQLGMTQKELAERLGTSQPIIVRWESGWAMPKLDDVIRIAEVLKCTPSWLAGFVGDGPDGNLIYESAVPVFDNYEDILAYINEDAEKLSKMHVIQNYRHVFLDGIDEADDDKLFGFIIQDDSMSPEYLAGNIVIVNNSIEPTPGKLVLAYLEKSKSLILRKYKVSTASASNVLTYELNAVNPDWPKLTIDNPAECKIIGVVIEYRQRA